MWDWFTSFLLQALQGIANFVGDWGLAIIILTAIIRILLTPLTLKSTRSSARMQVLQPKLKALQERYADDPQAQAQAMKEFYAENSFNPLGGCLPVLLQMPIFFALFAVLRDQLPVVAPDAHFYSLLNSLSMSVSGAISELGFLGAWVFIALDVLFAIMSFIPMYLNSKNSSPEQLQSMKVMGVVMSLMMLFVGWSLPVGVLLYYNTSALWGIIQQIFITQRVIDQVKKSEANRMGNESIKVDVVRRERKPRPHKKK